MTLAQIEARLEQLLNNIADCPSILCPCEDCKEFYQLYEQYDRMRGKPERIIIVREGEK